VSKSVVQALFFVRLFGLVLLSQVVHANGCRPSYISSSLSTAQQRGSGRRLSYSELVELDKRFGVRSRFPPKLVAVLINNRLVAGLRLFTRLRLRLRLRLQQASGFRLQASGFKAQQRLRA
jgi:hypothetical protein